LPASAPLANGNPQLPQSGATIKFSAAKQPAQNWPCAVISPPQHGQCGGSSTSSAARPNPVAVDRTMGQTPAPESKKLNRHLIVGL
jgi:hypothetical protein